jgi:hypothetical protein
VACVVAEQFKQTPVKGVITWATPHRLAYWLGLASQRQQWPVLSFAGRLDPFVPLPLANNGKVELYPTWNDHFLTLGLIPSAFESIGRKAAHQLAQA